MALAGRHVALGGGMKWRTAHGLASATDVVAASLLPAKREDGICMLGCRH